MTISINELFELALNNAVVLTPNARLTKSLKERYDLNQKNTVWPAIDIMPFNQWLLLLWQKYVACQSTTQPTFINEMQSNLIWLELIKQYSDLFYNAEQLAKKIKQAWSNCIAWQIDFEAVEFSDNAETEFFQEIVFNYQAQNPDKICQSQLINYLINIIDKDQISLPSSIIFSYFDEFTPLQKKLIALLKNKSKILYFDEKQNAEIIYRTQVKTKEEELTLVIEQIKPLINSDKQVGIVIPDLEQYRDHLETTLIKYFKKEEFNISMGKSLPQYAIINNAISLLSLPASLIDLKQIHLLCHSTFIAKSNSSRIKSFQKIQSTTEKMFNIDNVLIQVNDLYLKNNLPPMLRLLKSKVKLNLKQWSTKFANALEQIGFPGDKILNSEEYQLHIRFSHALIEFGSLMELEYLFTKAQALQLFLWQLNQIVFQPKAHTSKISFIGLLESLGLQFDFLFIMNMNENTLPPKPNPSPFIPLSMQRELEMPHASDERELRLASNQIKRLSTSANEVIFSHHLESDSKLLQASCLTKELPLKELEPTKTITIDNDSLESFAKINTAPILDLEAIRGGSYLIKEQSQCPFRAYSKFRLNINETRENLDGLDNLDKGVLLHKILELFYIEVKDQQTLIALDLDNKLSEFLNEIIEQAIEKFKNKKQHSFNYLFTKLEKKRLKKIVLKYLELEKQRPPFKVIHIEQESTFSLNQLNIKLRADRIDELENGDWLVIDYKSGNSSLSNLFDERLSEPQLPIYVLTSEKIKALLYAQLQQRNIVNKGISENDIEIKGVKTIAKQQKIDWSQQLESWHSKLDLLSQEFVSGLIIPKPSSEALCKTCDFITLCGLNR